MSLSSLKPAPAPDRWWAPQRPTTEPDAVVLAMLEPGDLGSALLAAHRAGAAAMETVSKGALPSEERLTGAMVTARANVSDRVVDSVANAVSTPTYAALLVRDVLDDAEEGALAVYRTAVAKGVSPPLAAARASAIYGVPAHALGTYLQLAADPRSNPAAVTDAADRALMTFVSKLVTQEGMVEFSKAPTGWAEKEHPRDEEGQFARKPAQGAYAEAPQQTAPEKTPPPPGVGSLAWLRQRLGMSELPGAPAKVADIEEEKKPEPKRAHRAKTMRRAKTAQRAAPAQARVGEAVRVGGAQRQATAQRVQSQMRRLAELTRITDEVNRATGADPEPTAPDTEAPTTPTYLYGRQKMASPYDLDPSFSLTLDARAAAAFMATIANQAGMLADPSMRVFRLGYLMDRAGAAHTSTSPETRDNLAGLARDVTEGDDYQNSEHPVVSVIHPQDMHRDPEHTKAYITARKFEMASGRSPSQGYSVSDSNPDPAVLKRVKAMPMWKPVGSSDMDAEHRPNSAPDIAIVKFPEGVPEPTVDEFVIDWGARGHEPENRHGDYELDPNQAYEFTNKPGAKPGERLSPHRLWDGEHGVVVNRWYLKPVDDSWVDSLLKGGNIGKAQQYQQAPEPQRPKPPATIESLNTVFEHLHPRDEHGRFAETATRSSLPSPSSMRLPERQVTSQETEQEKPKPARKAKTMRRAKTARRMPVTAAAQQAGAVRQGEARRQGTAIRSMAMSALSAHSLRHAVEAHRQRAERVSDEETLPELPVLDDRARYIVIDSGRLAMLLRDNHLEGASAGTLTDGRWVNNLFSAETRNGESVMGELNYNTQEEINQAEGPALHGYVWNRKPVGKGLLRPGNDDDELNLGNHIARLFANRLEIAQIHIDYGDDSYTLYANKEPVKPQALIEIDEELDWDQPVELIKLGEYRANEMLMRRADIPGAPLTSAISHQGIGDGAPANAAAMAFLMQNARVDRYRVQNADERGGDVPLWDVT